MREDRGVADPTVLAKDRGAFRTWLKDQPDDRIVCRVLKAFVRDDDSFLRKNGWGLRFLPGRANGYLAVRLPGDGRDHDPASPTPEFRKEVSDTASLVRGRFAAAWKAKYGVPCPPVSDRSAQTAAGKMRDYYAELETSEPFATWLDHTVTAYLAQTDPYVTRAQHPLALLPSRLGRLAAPPVAHRDRGTRLEDWAAVVQEAKEAKEKGAIQ
jgi:hypothetical protein